MRRSSCGLRPARTQGFFLDPGEIALTRGGVSTMTVGNRQSDLTGPHRLQLRAAPCAGLPNPGPELFSRPPSAGCRVACQGPVRARSGGAGDRWKGKPGRFASQSAM